MGALLYRNRVECGSTRRAPEARQMPPAVAREPKIGSWHTVTLPCVFCSRWTCRLAGTGVAVPASGCHGPIRAQTGHSADCPRSADVLPKREASPAPLCGAIMDVLHRLLGLKPSPAFAHLRPDNNPHRRERPYGAQDCDDPARTSSAIRPRPPGRSVRTGSERPGFAV